MDRNYISHLLILRHATAVPDSGEGDLARPLARKGMTEADACASALDACRKKFLHEVDNMHLLCSSAERTQRTAYRIFDHSRDYMAAPVRESALYNAPSNVLRCALEDAAAEGKRHILLVAHNPGVSDICRDILTACPEQDIVAFGRYLPLAPCQGMWYRFSDGKPRAVAAILPTGCIMHDES